VGELAPRLIGRDREVDELTALLASGRLVTVLGAGGVGKTRLALEVARRRRHAIADLSAITTTDAVKAEIAAALGINAGAADLVELVNDEPKLLVLDNCEHVVNAIADLAGRLLRGCPSLHLLATSREPLGIEGEATYRVHPLERDAAVELFIERARAADAAFTNSDPLVEQLCERLDRIPLAIELAAPWVRLLTPAELLARLAELLTGDRRDRPARHRSMRATVDWSYRLLSPEQQTLFQRLAVFAGTFDLPAAEHVGEATPAEIAALLDRSFLTVERHPTGTRYRMLETLRQFAEPTRHQVHAEYFRDRAERIDAERIATGCDARIADLVPDADNYRAALAWSSEHAPETALRLAAALEGFWMIRSVAEGQRWLRQALEQSSMPSVYRARALIVLPLMVGDGGGHLPESLRLYQAAADPTGTALARLTMSLAAFFDGDLTAALHHADAVVAGQPFVNARRACYRGAALAFTPRRFADAQAALLDAIDRTDAIGDGWGHGLALTLLGFAELHAGHRRAAADHFTAALAGHLRGGVTAAAIGGLGLLCRAEDPRRSALLLDGAAAVRERAGVSRFPVPIARALGQIDHRPQRRTTEELIRLARGEKRSPLTTRQLEVARLVADGLSNREIAERLFLSVRTVETHVENVLAALHLRRRIDLAGWVRDQDP